MSSIFWEQIKNKKAVKRLNCRAGADFEAGMFVENGVKLEDKPMFEKYLNRDPRRTKPQNLKTEIYVPINVK